MLPTVENRFGGGHTEIKLEMLMKYLAFFTVALKNKPRPESPWELVYIDAFAGTGSREYDDVEGNTCSSNGSALLALDIDPPFGKYFFIEIDDNKKFELERKLSSRNERRATVLRGDANEMVRKLLNDLNQFRNRGVIFLDPFAMEVEWSTLEAIASKGFLDLWFLVPLNAVSRMMPREGGIPKEWIPKLIRCFGEDPSEHLIEKQIQECLFPDEEEFSEEYLKNIRRGGTMTLATYIIKRLKQRFAWVSEEFLMLNNELNNSPMFMLVHCCSNDHPAAISLAKKAIGDIMRKHRSEGGNVKRILD